MGWDEAADYVLKGVIGAIQKKQLTFDLARARAGKKFIRPFVHLYCYSTY